MKNEGAGETFEKRGQGKMRKYIKKNGVKCLKSHLSGLYYFSYFFFGGGGALPCYIKQRQNSANKFFSKMIYTYEKILSPNIPIHMLLISDFFLSVNQEA